MAESLEQIALRLSHQMQLATELTMGDYNRGVTAFAKALIEALGKHPDPRIAELEAEVSSLKTVPMKYRRMEFNAQLQRENEVLRNALNVVVEKSVDAATEYRIIMKALALPDHSDILRKRDARVLRDAAEKLQACGIFVAAGMVVGMASELEGETE